MCSLENWNVKQDVVTIIIGNINIIIVITVTTNIFYCRQASVIGSNNNNNNGYIYLPFLLRAHSPNIKVKKKKTVEHGIRKNQQIRSTVHDAKSYLQ